MGPVTGLNDDILSNTSGPSGYSGPLGPVDQPLGPAGISRQPLCNCFSPT